MLCCVVLQQLYRKRPGMTMLCAKLPQNVSKNRYRDISPCTDCQHPHTFSPLSVFYLCHNYNRSESLWKYTVIEKHLFD